MSDGMAEIPDVRFWGMAVRAGDRGVYQIDNERGLMEMCHLTNVALAADGGAGATAKPIFVKLRSPEHEQAFVICALLPGRVYSCATDIIIAPDTQFLHTGGPGTEVHLTGYRSINADELLMADEDDGASDSEATSEDASSSGDEGQDASGDSGDAADEGDERLLGLAAQKVAAESRRAKRRVEPDVAGGPAGVSAERRLNKRISAANIRADGAAAAKQALAEVTADGAQEDIGDDVDDEDDSDFEFENGSEGLSGDFIEDGSDEMDADNDQAAEAPRVSTAELKQAVRQVAKPRVTTAKLEQLDKAVAAAAKSAHSSGGKIMDAMASASDSEDGDLGDLFGPPEDSETDNDDEEGRGDPALMEAASAGKKRKAEREAAPARAEAKAKQKERRESASAASPSGEAPAKKAKVDAKLGAKPGANADARPDVSGVKLAFPAHPDGADAATQSYVETLAKYLKQNDGRMKLSVLGIKCKRPSHIKFGKILEMYQKWFKRSGAKGQEEMVLLLK